MLELPTKTIRSRWRRVDFVRCFKRLNVSFPSGLAGGDFSSERSAAKGEQNQNEKNRVGFEPNLCIEHVRIFAEQRLQIKIKLPSGGTKNFGSLSFAEVCSR